MIRLLPGALALLVLSGVNVQASIVIGPNATKHMTCSGGVCSPTARDAALNVTDLENLLASQGVRITTTGSNIQAENIVIAAPLGWSGSSGLVLQAYRSIAVAAPVTVGGPAALTLSAYDGTLWFRHKGSVTFQNLASPLTINGTVFNLVDSVGGLASAVASDPAGAYALANPYDASGDGTYTQPPVKTVFSGVFEGLGNTISNLTIDDTEMNGSVGLFAEVSGAVRDVGLIDAHVSASNSKSQTEIVGTLIGTLDAGGAVSVSFATGSNSSGSAMYNYLGGLIGSSTGDVRFSHANVSVVDVGTQSETLAGGLIAISFGTVEQSFSEGSVESVDTGYFGGFVGQNAEGPIINCYETGAVTASNHEAGLGGFAGTAADSSINESYATGLVSGGGAYAVGGFTGTGGYGFENDYWDVKTSGQTYGTGDGNLSGITGVTNKQLQSKLPDGFESNIWKQKKGVNRGFPNLRHNHP